MNKFQFNPPSGLLDTSAYPTNPATEAEARGQIQDPLNQIKNYLNLLLDDFVFSKNTNGYTKLPNGLILQWGEFTITDMSNVNARYINFPILFPNRCFSVIGNLSAHDGFTNPRIIPYLLWSNNESNFYFRIAKIGLPQEATISTAKCSWIAVGY